MCWASKLEPAQNLPPKDMIAIDVRHSLGQQDPREKHMQDQRLCPRNVSRPDMTKHLENSRANSQSRQDAKFAQLNMSGDQRTSPSQALGSGVWDLQ